MVSRGHQTREFDWVFHKLIHLNDLDTCDTDQILIFFRDPPPVDSILSSRPFQSSQFSQ